MDQTSYHQQNKTFGPGSGYEKIKRLVDFEKGPKLSILELGSGNGMLGQMLISFGHSVTGLEINPTVATNSWVMQKDVSKPWNLGSKFDLIICTDIAEHLENPQHILEQAKLVLKPGGKVIFGVPNHFDIRQRLRIFLGKGIVHWDNIRHGQKAWTYAHLRFLTIKDLSEMFKNNGWFIEKSQYNFMGAGIIPAAVTPKSTRLFLLKTWPNLFSGKFIFVLGKHISSHKEAIYLASTPSDF